MRAEYDFSKLNARKNPYADRLKKQEANDSDESIKKQEMEQEPNNKE